MLLENAELTVGEGIEKHSLIYGLVGPNVCDNTTLRLGFRCRVTSGAGFCDSWIMFGTQSMACSHTHAVYWKYIDTDGSETPDPKPDNHQLLSPKALIRKNP